jgi:hypothetical protein
MLDKIKMMKVKEIEITNEITELAERYIEFGVLSDKHYEDALHIAAASVEKCEVLASWNFKHIVRIKTILGANGINRAEGYGEVQLLSPDALVEEGDEE